MIHALIDRVSKNGNMLRNISPTLEGPTPTSSARCSPTAAPTSTASARRYATRAWDTYGEGPTKMGGGSFVAPKVGTARDIRFTRDKAARVLHATVLAWPGETLNITTLSSERIDLTGLRRVELLGAEGPLTHVQDTSGLRVTLPAKPYESPAYVVKLTFAGRIPALGPETGARVFADRSYRGTTAALAVGTCTAAQPPQRISSLWPADGYQALGYPGDNLTGTPTTFVAPTPDLRAKVVSLRVTFDPARWFRLANVAGGLALDSGGLVPAGSNLKIWTPGDSTNLQFRAEEAGDGFFTLTNRTNGFVIDGAGATQPGAYRCSRSTRAPRASGGRSGTPAATSS